MKDLLADHPIAHERVRVYSFDLFDTVLTRSVCPPEVVFIHAAQMADKHLPPACTPAHFAHLRQRADARARRWHGDNKTLDDIYCELQNSLNLSASATERLKAAELAVEERVLYPVPRIQEALQSLRARGVDIAFTSDMYLPPAFLKERLVEHGIWQAGDRLFVSCAYGLQKSGGGLFEPVLQDAQCDAHEAVHVGNCEYADMKGARQAGLQPVHFDAGNPNRYEEILAAHAPKTAGLTGSMAGASRYARLHTEASSRRERALRDVTAGVMAPILTGFMLWILDRAREERLERLYFTSRDGHALVPIARRLADALGVDCTFNYLYLSRAALTAANPDSDTLYHMLEFEEASGEAVLSRYGLDVEDVLPHLPAENASQQIRSRPLTEEGKHLITTALSRLRDGSHAIPKIDQNRDLLRRYLMQEGLHEAGRFGFVDIGWKGSVHSLLSDFLQEEGLRTRPLPAFLFGLSTPQQPHATHRRAYFFDAYRKLGYRNVLQPGSAIFTLMETFCTADHGTVTGYRNDGDRVVPTLESTWAARVSEWGLPVVRRTLGAFVDGLTHYTEGLSHRTDAREAFVELLQTFWHGPSRAEAHAWGTFPREIGQSRETPTKPLAPPYRWSALLPFARHGPRAPKHILHRFSWPQGALARSSPALQTGIDVTVRLRRRLKRLARKVINRIPNWMLNERR
jgi:FMN phosphatase YigB (HAD superfamily)